MQQQPPAEHGSFIIHQELCERGTPIRLDETRGSIGQHRLTTPGWATPGDQGNDFVPIAHDRVNKSLDRGRVPAKTLRTEMSASWTARHPSVEAGRHAAASDNASTSLGNPRGGFGGSGTVAERVNSVPVVALEPQLKQRWTKAALLLQLSLSLRATSKFTRKAVSSTLYRYGAHHDPN